MDVDLDKEVYTTFETAKICNANITSIKNWIDKGDLAAFRTPGGHYRIEHDVLEDFLNRHQMPNPFARRDQRRVLLVGRHPERIDTIEAHFGAQHRYKATDSAAEGVLTIGNWRPDVAIVDAGINGIDPVELAESIAEIPDLCRVQLLALHDGDDAYDARLEQAGLAAAIGPSADQTRLLEAVDTALRARCN